ncbi:transport and Golgi organization protein 11 [Adelges cooleyi]|uniref:transport and Golgi organization protein 11 n=1 Tax=Adelges cooleyi TaxID=133065 RepID=UPI00217FF69A|nr:transport and Golgi organization protein 11 [Adelges cooleyi]XP_050432674.1 transport and Golgi organization protein 11 [Adelges cooleyi]
MEDYNGYDSNFTEEISKKMQVPKSIRANGDYSNFRPTSFYSDETNPYGDNFDMQVPEKIVLLGHNQHMGTSSKPKEFAIDDIIIPQPPPEEILRVQTPPSKITMSRHYFPSVLDDFDRKHTQSEQSIPPEVQQSDGVLNSVQQGDLNTTFFNASLSEPMTLAEEVAHLRQQMSRASRRIIELEHRMSQPFYVREKKLVITIVGSYLLLKMASWLTKH